MLNCLTQKVEMNVLIPAIRKEFIIVLEKEGLSDAEISRKLGITKSAVSQYKHKKRGRSIKFNDKMKKEIQISVKSIIKGKNANTEISKLIAKTKQCRYICTICRECKC